MNNSGALRKLTPFGYEQLTALNVVSALSPPNGSRIAVLRCEAQNVRWRDDKDNTGYVDPTATVGQLMLTTDDLMVYTGLMGQIRFIEAAAGAILNVTYYS